MDYGTIAGIDGPVSRIIFGTDRLWSRRQPWLPVPGRERRAFSLLDRAFELGCNTFDTARTYRDGERTLGAWIRTRRIRDDVVVISKGGHPHGSGRPRLSASDVSHDLHASLKALGTDSIDLYLLHYDDPTADVEPVMERLDRHIAEGKIGVIGTSNWAHQRVADANAMAAHNGLNPFAASSVQFSLADWTAPPWPGAVTLGGREQQAAREWYSTRGLSVLAWSSLARGFFSDHYDPTNTDENAVSRWCATYFDTEENLARRERALVFARENGVTVARVALAYVLRHPLHVFAIVGCTTEAKLADDVGATSLELDEATLRWLDGNASSR
ncbi:aldo/keto reductase [Mycobacterium hodleri]|uniref:Aldo/keto reductase n=1 Tax=Mycolicibacterium hodleri TaxID=49897 RepID=A0A544W4U6_9MYCO|nr:aldo/keto reductase [Mycolicibacterium hodleri]TQR87251.1 aldo/keto reductase [Mycolicibacterium hodleri]